MRAPEPNAVVLAALVLGASLAGACAQRDPVPAGVELTRADPCAGATHVVCLDLAGAFHATADRGPSGAERMQFELALYARTPSGAPGKEYRVGIARYGAGQPAAGRYALEPPEPLDRVDPGGRLYAVYLAGARHPGDTTRGFVSVSGELVVTESSAQRLAGTFRFTGREYFAAWSPGGQRGSGTPAEPSADGGTVVVSGTFTASGR